MFKLLLLGCLICLISAEKPYPTLSDPTRIPGTVSIGQNICMGATEVTLKEWLDFIANNDFDPSLYPENSSLSDPWTKLIFEDLKNKGNFKHLKVTRTSINHHQQISIWLKNDAFCDSLKKIEYPPLNSPVTGISFEQAIRFCKWKESLINKDRDNSKKIQIGLPSKEIYKRVIENIDSLCVNCSSPCRSFRFNYKHPSCQDKESTNSFEGKSLLRVDSYWPTSLGMFGIQGNAAEMTSSKGIAMGGSFKHYANQSLSTEVQSYSGPEDWLGFRYVVTLDASPATDKGH
jgi:formylglycine-generating enzyme required for sulfatase activity